MPRHAPLLVVLLAACAGEAAQTTGEATEQTGSSGAQTGTSWPMTGTPTTGTPTGSSGDSSTSEAPTTDAPAPDTDTSSTGEVEASTDSSSTGGSSSGETSSGTSLDSSSGSSSGSSSTTGAPETCGDGELDPGEACDDGNDVDDDGCDNACQSANCGDGIVQAGLGEQCDDGPGNADSADCTLACKQAVCGDGLVHAGVEACDDGNDVDDDACDGACVAASCDDGEQNGAETDVDCGGPTCDACPFLLLLGGNTSAAIGGHFAGGAWTLDPIAAPTVDGLDVAITSAGVGVGLLRYTKLGDAKDQQLQAVTWQGGEWSAPVQVGADTTRAAPSLYADGASVHAVFQGENYQHYHAVYAGGVWNPVAEPIGGFGPGPGSVVRFQGEPMFVFHDGSAANVLKARRRTGAWMQFQTIDGDTDSFDRQPAAVALAGGGAMVVHARNSGPLRASACGVMCAAPVDVANAETSAPPALAALAAGGVALAFRGLDGRLYVALNDGDGWDAPAAVLANNAQIHGAPALAAGIDGAVLELVYLDAASKQVRHVRRLGGAWTAPTSPGGPALERVAIERSPFAL